MTERFEFATFITGVAVVLMTIVIAITYYNTKQLEAMKSNIESAIVKGIDPIAVRCAYESSSTMCVVYSSRK